MTTAVVESPETDRALGLLHSDALVVEHGSALDVETVALKMTLPVCSAPRLHEDVGPMRGRRSLVARWVPDMRGEYGLICTWVPDPAEMSVSSNG